jgi:hypothetical protein
MRGTHSAHFHTDNNGLSFIKGEDVSCRQQHLLGAKMFFYVDALPVTPDYAHFTIIEAAKLAARPRCAKVASTEIRCRHRRRTDGDWTNIDAARSHKDSAKGGSRKSVDVRRGGSTRATPARPILLGRRRAPLAVHVP